MVNRWIPQNCQRGNHFTIFDSQRDRFFVGPACGRAPTGMACLSEGPVAVHGTRIVRGICFGLVTSYFDIFHLCGLP